MNDTEKEIILITNRKASHEYFIDQTIEVGIVLKGTEVKSLRRSQGNFIDSFAEIINGELWLKNMHISEFSHGNINNHEEKRIRKLLVKKNELRKLKIKTSEKGYTLIPLKAYLKNGKIKIEIAIARGKRMYDKRHSIAKKDAEMEINRRMKEFEK